MIGHLAEEAEHPIGMRLWKEIDATPEDGSEPPPPDTQCADGIDNDGDGLIDFPQDTGCTDLSDDDESEPPPSVIEHARTITVEVKHSLSLTVTSPASTG